MREYTIIDGTKICFDKFNNGGNMAYTLMTRQKVKNVLVDCDYYEGSDHSNIQYYTFHVIIKVFGKHPYKPQHCFEIYANTLYPKYNSIKHCTKTTDRKIEKDSKDYVMISKVLAFINENFEDFTKQFIDHTTQIVNSKRVNRDTPEFIINLIKKIDKNHTSNGCLNN